MVQSLTMNGVRISLPTFGVFTGTREILKDLQIATLDILSAASNSECSKEDILKRISFVMSDSTSHKLGVTEAVCEELEVEDVPLTLVCNVCPLMVFDYQIKELVRKSMIVFGIKNFRPGNVAETIVLLPRCFRH